MNPFFEPPPEQPGFTLPPLVYARLIDSDPGAYALFDAVDAKVFDGFAAGIGANWERGAWLSAVEQAPIYAVEVNALDAGAADWLAKHVAEEGLEWVQITLSAHPDGEVAVYDNIVGVAQRARADLQPVEQKLAAMLKTATDLSPWIEPEDDIAKIVPAQAVAGVLVLDVGQGAAQALVDAADDIIAYVDLGAGVLRDSGTWPADMTGICLVGDPIVILSHWHYDHFHAANIFPAARNRTWIAPLQTLGPGPQSAMAGAIAKTGRLLIWNGGGLLKAGSIELERCTGPVGDQNRTGIAVWAEGPAGTEPILLPGDAGYDDFQARTISSFVLAHHGGRAPGTPPARPGGAAPRVALSYGHNNQYRHPRNGSLAPVLGQGWTLGHVHAGADERRTAMRPGGIGGKGLGHIRLDWSSGTGLPAARICPCGCTLSPTQ